MFVGFFRTIQFYQFPLETVYFQKSHVICICIHECMEPLLHEFVLSYSNSEMEINSIGREAIV